MGSARLFFTNFLRLSFGEASRNEVPRLKKRGFVFGTEFVRFGTRGEEDLSGEFNARLILPWRGDGCEACSVVDVKSGKSGWFKGSVLKLHDPEGLGCERESIVVGEDVEMGEPRDVAYLLARRRSVAIGVRDMETGGSAPGRNPAIVTASVGGSVVAVGVKNIGVCCKSL